ncbi:hypothetical protein GCM10022222_59660 [Amycolatopsis ultiminotia]|uniref:Periplasmic binding protein domain-containing protein n=1 Tax=Amycolatopsis ultiminotia TaxID=543629 RepID=A0ABP6XIF4_9PSEU
MKDTSASHFRRAVAGVASIVLAGALATACTSTSASNGAGGKVADQQTLNRFYAGDYLPVPTSGPRAVPGKKVWMISCGQAFQQCALGSEAFEEAGKKIGWNVTVVDSKANPSTANDLIKQGVAAGVDGIAVYAFDCPTIKGGLLAARQAGIPTVNFSGLDCDYGKFGGQPLFTRTLHDRGGDSFENYAAEYQQARADVLLAYAGKKAKILDLQETSLTNSAVKTEKFTARIKQKCPGCEIVPVKWSYSQVPAAATQIWKSAIQKHPEATVLANDVDDIIPLGLQSAIRQSGRTDLKVIGAEGSGASMQAIRDGSETAALAILPGYVWQMWGLADTLNRVFAGSKDFPDEGGGWTLVDKQHMPAPGKSISVPDFKAGLMKIWVG